MSKVIFNGIELNGTQALPELTYAEYDALSVKPEYWILKDDALSEDKVSITASSDTWRTALMKLYALADVSRINTKSMLSVWESDAIGEKLYTVHLINKKTGQINFTRPTAYTSVTTDTFFIFPNVVYTYNNTSDTSNTSVADGVVFTLYYNTATLGQINTKAENCIYGNGNVKDALDKLDIYKTYNLTDSMYYGVTSHSGMWYIFYIPLFPIESGDVVSLSLSDVSIYIGNSIYTVSDLSLADTEIRIGDMGIRIDLKFTSAHSIDAFGVLRVNSNGGTMTVSKQ